MKYQMINEELQIASCSIADLTMEQVNHFLGQWEPGSSIGMLTLFFDETGLVVLNRDHRNYELYKKFAESYLKASEEQRNKMSTKLSDMLKDEIDVLNACISFRTVELEVNRALHSYIPVNSDKVLNEICRRYDGKVVAAVAFRYGVMVGKRVERAKKKKTA